jgi:hypothetical protein
MTIPRNTGGGDVVQQSSGGGDRRRVCRYAAALQDASLGWWEGSCFVEVPARLVNVSANGCLVELARLPKPRARESIWFQSRKASLGEWTEGRIVSVRKPLLRKCKISISFAAPFAYESFKKMVYGLEQVENDTRTEAPEHERDNFWK